MGYHEGYSGYADPRNSGEQREKLVGIIRRNRKKILFALAGVLIATLIVGILLTYLIFLFLVKGKDIVLNPTTINQFQKVATGSGQFIPQNLPQNLPQNELLQNFNWILNLIKLFQSFAG